jgi:hypothetical protein
MKRQVVIQRDRVDRGIDAAGGEQGRQARGEAQAARRRGGVERLDAEPVAHQHHAAAVAFVNREREHALQALAAARTPGMPGLEHHFGVAVGEKAVAERFELGAQRAVVVDAAVEHQRQAERRIGHRLLGALAEVNDLEAAVAEADPAARHDAGGVRASLFHRRVHR